MKLLTTTLWLHSNTKDKYMQTSQQHTRKPNKTQSTQQTVKQKDIAENFDLA